MSLLTQTHDALRATAEKWPHCVVAFSGGKDSLVTIDLARRFFKTVSAFHMYFVPGLAVVDEFLAAATARWGVTFKQYPHWGLRQCLQTGMYCFNGLNTDDLTAWTMNDVYDLALAETGAGCVLNGAKGADSVWRKRTLAAITRPDLIHPVRKWSKKDVLAYLYANKIPLPPPDREISLGESSILWLHREHPADFARLARFFPFAEAVVWRHRWYGR